jgi:cell division protein FtsB
LDISIKTLGIDWDMVDGVIEAMDKLRADNAELRAEVERWRDACGADHVKRVQTLESEVERLRAALTAIRAMVNQQAEDEGLWFIHVTASEAYLQQELRSLHDRIERLTA